MKRELIKQPTLGRARMSSKYRVYYESDRPGADEIAYKTTWEQHGKIATATVRIKIRVLDRAI